MGFVCHFFGVGAVQNPIKHTPVAEAVPEHIFNMFFQKSHQKTRSKKVSVFTFPMLFFLTLKRRTLFTPFLPKWPQRHQKGHLNALFFNENWFKYRIKEDEIELPE